MTLSELLIALGIITVLSMMTWAVPLPGFIPGDCCWKLLQCQLEAMETMTDQTETVISEQGQVIEEKYNRKGRVNHPCTLQEQGVRMAVELAGGRIIEK